jgi:hypothetical protein
MLLSGAQIVNLLDFHRAKSRPGGGRKASSSVMTGGWRCIAESIVPLVLQVRGDPGRPEGMVPFLVLTGAAHPTLEAGPVSPICCYYPNSGRWAERRLKWSCLLRGLAVALVGYWQDLSIWHTVVGRGDCRAGDAGSAQDCRILVQGAERALPAKPIDLERYGGRKNN